MGNLENFLSQTTVTDGVYNATTWCGSNNKKESIGYDKVGRQKHP